MLAMVELDYHATRQENLAKLGREKYLNLCEEIPQLGLSAWQEEKDAPEYWYRNGPFLIDLLTDGVLLASLEIPFEVKRFKGTYRLKDKAVGGEYHLHVAIPAIGLLAMDEVLLVSDGCTDELSDLLREGWRIIAVCPPDAQRRPDYILGRSPEMRPKG